MRDTQRATLTFYINRGESYRTPKKTTIYNTINIFSFSFWPPKEVTESRQRYCMTGIGFKGGLLSQSKEQEISNYL